MKKTTQIFLLFSIISISLQGQLIDVPFRQVTSVKYSLSDDLKGAELKKVVVDYNDIVYVLTDKGLYRDYKSQKNCFTQENVKCIATIPIPLHWIREAADIADWLAMSIYCLIGWQGILT